MQTSPESRQLKRREPGKGRPGDTELLQHGLSATIPISIRERGGCGYHTGIGKAEGRGRG